MSDPKAPIPTPVSGNVRGPSTDAEWTIHSLNIHGIFFERWCAHIAATSSRWKTVSTNVPVEFPPPNGPIRGKESALDLWLGCEQGEDRLSLLIECKKNNPDFVDWIFFRKPISNMKDTYLSSQLTTHRVSKGWLVKGSVNLIGTDFPIADDGRESRGNYQEYKDNRVKTKTSNAAIAEAAHQVAIATKSITLEQLQFDNVLGNHQSAGDPPYKKHLFFPLIVTTARLIICDYDPADIEASKGEILPGKAEVKPVDALIYEYALPRSLQSHPDDLFHVITGGHIEGYRRMHILVVNGSYFPEFLKIFYNSELPSARP